MSMTITQAAEYWRVSISTVRRWVKEGRLNSRLTTGPMGRYYEIISVPTARPHDYTPMGYIPRVELRAPSPVSEPAPPAEPTAEPAETREISREITPVLPKGEFYLTPDQYEEIVRSLPELKAKAPAPVSEPEPAVTPDAEKVKKARIRVKNVSTK